MHVTIFWGYSISIRVTGEHPILSVNRDRSDYKNEDWTPTWKDAAHLKKGDYVAIPICRTVISKPFRFFSIPIGAGRHSKEDIQFGVQMNKDFFRLVGYYMAEGSVINDHYLCFTFNKSERDYIDDVKLLLEDCFGKVPLENKEYNNGISIVLCSTIAARLFSQEFGKGALTKKLPAWFMFEDPAKQAEFIKGYWRGDGSYINKKYTWGTKRMFRINTISEHLAEQSRDILLRLNIFASINVWKKQPPRKTAYAVYIGGSYLSTFENLLGENDQITEGKTSDSTSTSTIFSDSTMQVQEQIFSSYSHITEHFAFVPLKKVEIEEVSNLDVYNFSVVGDESYTVHGIAVHNCTAPIYSSDSLHAAVVEVIAHKNAKIRYTTIQNWSGDVYNLVTKRAFAHENSTIEWIDGNLGSKLTMKYPSVYLVGRQAKADILSVAYAGAGQHQDAGGKVVHLAPDTTSRIISKSVSKDGGRSTYRGLVRIAKGATNSTSSVRCDALLLDEKSRSDTYPTMKIDEEESAIAHEAFVGKIGEEQLFYLMSRGLPESEALALIVLGFINEFTKELPMDYAIELNKLIRLEMEGSIG